ncbi:LOW QUALITY PROTEIN: class I histocompatibility antigen, Gogo-B*0201 alpha chain-like [Takifugu flavidus]|uniref:LOW QUALITY PROTEIN: class I histocompatibility antigen, Gogo-B*0201 alpha chain-like n=1 Tax=Takifugu flavidus TaxID=433684 RepID=UPI002544C0A1|nr:LOW QUALITY PROTEIN: class I histocompatibility antigen, Gogo-B*0201 alpha chain-like [Takifugu flavidus]
MLWQILLLLHFYSLSAEKHYLRYFLTASTGATNFQDFLAQVVADDLQGGYCDSNGVKPRDEWAERIAEDDPVELKFYTDVCVYHVHTYRAHVKNLNQQFNQSEGIHVFQRIFGCEWDDETGKVTAFNQFGYDGEDFIALDPETMTWVAAKPQALITKRKWDNEITYLEKKIFNTQICPERLKKYLQYIQKFHQRDVQPSVFLLQKTPSSPVSCHATGFYPKEAVMFWRKDGEKLHEEVEDTEILPNHDGTFQRSVDLKLSSVSPEEWSRYECVFQLPGVVEDIAIVLDTSVIRTNWVPPAEFPTGVVAGVVVVVLLLLLASIMGYYIWKRPNIGFSRASASDPSSQGTPEFQ